MLTTLKRVPTPIPAQTRFAAHGPKRPASVYLCHYLMEGEEPGVLARTIRVEATSGAHAAQKVLAMTGCASVIDVVRED